MGRRQQSAQQLPHHGQRLQVGELSQADPDHAAPPAPAEAFGEAGGQRRLADAPRPDHRHDLVARAVTARQAVQLAVAPHEGLRRLHIVGQRQPRCLLQRRTRRPRSQRQRRVPHGADIADRQADGIGAVGERQPRLAQRLAQRPTGQQRLVQRRRKVVAERVVEVALHPHRGRNAATDQRAGKVGIQRTGGGAAGAHHHQPQHARGGQPPQLVAHQHLRFAVGILQL